MMNDTFKKSVVAGTLALMVFAGTPSAQAQTPSVADLQSQINQLMATIAELQARVQQNTGTNNFGQYTWTRSLGQGSTGEDVRALQRFLNSDPDTRVALSGAGSPGNETMFFGPATAAGVAKFQTKYRSEVLTPLGLMNPTGFFGPSSLAKANTLTKATPTVPTNPTTPTNPGDDDDVTAPPMLQGNGMLDTFEIRQADDTNINEAASDAVVAELRVEAGNGDIRIDRMDIKLTADNGNDERDPWDTFETLSLWIDGEKVAEKHIDDRSNFLNRNNGTVRLSGLNIILEQDEEVEMLVAVSVKSRVDGAGGAAEWSVGIDSMRYFDADRVAMTENSFGDIGDMVAFSILERGAGEELKFTLSANNPEATNIIVDESQRTNNVTILEYVIEAIDADIELDRLYVNIETGSASYSDVVADIRLNIGNKTFRRDAVVSTGNYSATSTRVAFDIDGDITIDEGDKENVRVVVDLRPQTAYMSGETILAQVTSLERDETRAEGTDDIASLSGTAIGKQHTLVSEGIISSPNSVSFSNTTQGQNNTTGIFTMEFEVTAIEGDYYITDTASTSASNGVQFMIESSAGTPDSVSAVLTSTAQETTDGVFVIREGRTETMTLTVVVDAAAAGQHRIALQAINFSDATDGISNIETFTVSPSNAFRSGYLFINN